MCQCECVSVCVCVCERVTRYGEEGEKEERKEWEKQEEEKLKNLPEIFFLVLQEMSGMREEDSQ